MWYILVLVCIQYFGFLSGIFAYLLIIQVIKRYLKHFLNIEMMSGNDEIFFLDDSRAYLNIVAFQKYEKWDYKTFRDKIVRKARQFPRLKSRVVKLFGLYMFQQMDDQEFLDNIENTCSEHTGVHNEEQLAEFMAKVQGERERLDFIQWRCYFFPDYNEKESVFVFKVHHSLADGIATVLMFFNLCDDPDYKDFPNLLVRFPVVQEILLTLAYPFILGYYTYVALTLPVVPNPFNEPKMRNNMTPVKNVVFSKDIGVPDIKSAIVKHTVNNKKPTFNDILMTAFSKTLKDYCLTTEKYKQVDEIELVCPFSLRPPPIGILDFEYNNDFAIVPVNLKLHSDLKDGLKKINKAMTELKKSITPVGMAYVNQVTMALPEFLR